MTIKVSRGHYRYSDLSVKSTKKDEPDSRCKMNQLGREVLYEISDVKIVLRKGYKREITREEQ